MTLFMLLVIFQLVFVINETFSEILVVIGSKEGSQEGLISHLITFLLTATSRFIYICIYVLCVYIHLHI